MTLIVATLCPEGIALTADSKCMVTRHWTNPETGEQRQKIFQDREQTVGPPIDVLVITQDGGRWFQKRDIIV